MSAMTQVPQNDSDENPPYSGCLKYILILLNYKKMCEEVS